MSCYYPRFGYLKPYFDENGDLKQRFQFVSRELRDKVNSGVSLDLMTGEKVRVFSVPCGMCNGCRNDHAREWAARCVCESLMYPPDTCHFLTLTYNDEHLPRGKKGLATTDIHSLSRFMKSMQEYFYKHFGHIGLRYFIATEYGEKHSRPHAHLLLFNAPFPAGDFKRLGNNFRGDCYFTSQIIDKLWRDENEESNGFHVIAELTIDTAAYTARYAMKKLKGHAKEFYDRAGIEPEAQRCSLRPGIGAAYAQARFDKIYSSDKEFHYCFNSDTGYSVENLRDKLILPNGIVQKPPRYFDKLYARQNDASAYNMQLVKLVRNQNGDLSLLSKLARCNYTEEQLLHIEADQYDKAASKLIRGFEKGIL